MKCNETCDAMALSRLKQKLEIRIKNTAVLGHFGCRKYMPLQMCDRFLIYSSGWCWFEWGESVGERVDPRAPSIAY